MVKKAVVVLAALVVAGIPVASAAGSGSRPHECKGADSGTYRDVAVKKGDNCTFSGHARSVSVKPGGALTLVGAVLSHNLTSNKASMVTIGSGSRIHHDAVINATTGTVTISDSTIGHDLHVVHTAGVVTVSGSTIGHDAQFQRNHSVVLTGNHIAHDLRVGRNASATVNANTVGRDGDCKGANLTGAGNTYGHRNHGCPA